MLWWLILNACKSVCKLQQCHSVSKQQKMLSSDVVVEDSHENLVTAMLVKQILAMNSKDNISVVVVDLKCL